MKLAVSRGRNGVVGYTIFINKAEAEASGFINADGNPIEIEKVVDTKNGRILVRRAEGGGSKTAIKSGFVYQHMNRLKAGEDVRTARNEHYLLKGNILYKQRHQPYLRGESPKPYAELIGGVFYGIDTE